MSLDTDEEGFVYFNDLLYKAMRNLHGDDHVRNRLLGEAEMKVMIKIKRRRLKISKTKRKAEKHEQASVNPFLTMMYYNMSFKAWKNRWIKNLERRLNEIAYDLERDSSDEEDDLEDVEINE
jgi:hypothetical protein